MKLDGNQEQLILTFYFFPIDIDILLFSNKKIDEIDLIIPHKEMLNRLFVLIPLIEIYDGDYFEKEVIVKRIDELFKIEDQKIQKIND